MIIPGKIKKAPAEFRFFYIQQAIADLRVCCMHVNPVEVEQHTSFIQITGSIFITCLPGKRVGDKGITIFIFQVTGYKVFP